MSIVVAVRVGEGLVVAADSASTLLTRIPDGSPGVVKVFNHATKLMQLKDYPIAVAAWGAGNLGSRTVSSLVEEYANTRPSIKTNEVRTDDISVRSEAETLKNHLMSFASTTGPEAGLGVLVGGYSGKEFFPEEYAFNVPKGDFQLLRQPGPDAQQDFGANWYGLVDACVRLHHGRDDQLPAILEKHGIAKDTISAIMQHLQLYVQYAVPFAGMPLQDAVDYSMYLVGVVVGRYRFVMGPELCGGPIDVATVTRQEGFRWIQRKELAARHFGPQI